MSVKEQMFVLGRDMSGASVDIPAGYGETIPEMEVK